MSKQDAGRFDTKTAGAYSSVSSSKEYSFSSSKSKNSARVILNVTLAEFLDFEELNEYSFEDDTEE